MNRSKREESEVKLELLGQVAENDRNVLRMERIDPEQTDGKK